MRKVDFTYWERKRPDHQSQASKGKYKIVIKNNRLHYEFEIKRNITIIQGDSATGKNTLINIIRQAENLGPSSGIEVTCNIPCTVLEGANWKLILENSSYTIFFTDEENKFINTEEFATAVRDSDNYHVLITRENLYNLPYSVEEIYGIHCSVRYHDTRRMYQQMYQIAQSKATIYTSLYSRFIFPPMITLYGTTSPSDMITSRKGINVASTSSGIGAT